MEKVLRQNEASAQFPLQNIRSYFKYCSLTDFGKTEHFRNQIGVLRGQNDHMLFSSTSTLRNFKTRMYIKNKRNVFPKFLMHFKYYYTSFDPICTL